MYGRIAKIIAVAERLLRLDLPVGGGDDQPVSGPPAHNHLGQADIRRPGLGVLAADGVDAELAKLAVEEAVIGAAAELSIGHEAKSEPLLQRDGLANSRVLARRQLGARDLALREGGARVEQGFGA